MTLEDYALDEVKVWPENWLAFELFHKLQTQWRTGAMGATGLDYDILFSLLNRRRLNDQDFDQIFADVQVMEISALNTMNKKA